MTTVIARYTLPALDFDPTREFSALTDDQRDDMNTEFSDAWHTKASAVLAPIGGYLNPSTGEIEASLENAGGFTDEMREALDHIDADPDDAIFTKWAEINDTMESTPITAQVTDLGEEQQDGTAWDTITLYKGDVEIDEVQAESSEDPEPYDEALHEAGYTAYTWLNGIV